MSSLQTLENVRAAKPSAYPDQTVYAEFAAAAFALGFEELDGGSGLVFRIASPDRAICFGGGRCSYFPQNNATAATLAADKYFSNVVLENAGIQTLGGNYFFLTARHRAHRRGGHERNDATAYFRALGGHVFVKPLTGSRGDFARAVHDEETLSKHLDEVARQYDSIIMQPIAEGLEYRLFVLDDNILYGVRKRPPCVVGDGATTLRALLAAREKVLDSLGVSVAAPAQENLDRILPAGERWIVPGPTNRSAGGDMTFGTPRAEQRAGALAVKAVRALGLRAAAIDLFSDVGGDPEAIRVIEVNANPSIRFLEDSGRGDLILAIWRHAFMALGLLRV